MTFETKKKWPYKTDVIIKKIMTGQEKGDLLIQVIA